MQSTAADVPFYSTPQEIGQSGRGDARGARPAAPPAARSPAAGSASHAAVDINGDTAFSMAITYRSPATAAIVHLLFAAGAV